MFTLTRIEEELEYLKPYFEKVLEDVQRELHTKIDLKFEANKKKSSKNLRFELISEGLPMKELGLWKYAVKEMIISIDGTEFDEEIIFRASFYYQHRGGGRNGCDILNLWDNRLNLRYKKEEVKS